MPRLPGTDCYEVFAGAARMRALLEAEPGTYVLTDYLATSFHRSVVVELGLDRFPELRDDYFGHYRRVVWLAQHPTARVRAAAERAAGVLGLPLEEVVVGDALLEGRRAARRRPRWTIWSPPSADHPGAKAAVPGSNTCRMISSLATSPAPQFELKA